MRHAMHVVATFMSTLAACAHNAGPSPSPDSHEEPAAPITSSSQARATPRVDFYRESYVWRNGLGAENELLYVESAEAHLEEVHDDHLHGEVRYPSEVNADSGAPLNTTFIVEEHLAELHLGSETIDLAARRADAEVVLAWEHLLFTAPALFPLRPGTIAAQTVASAPITRVLGKTSPVPGGVLRALRWDSPVPKRYREVTNGPITVLSDPDTGVVRALQVDLQEPVMRMLYAGSTSSRCHIHYVHLSSEHPEAVVIQFIPDSGPSIVEDRHYGTATTAP